jgi:cytochrome c biogenesis protein
VTATDRGAGGVGDAGAHRVTAGEAPEAPEAAPEGRSDVPAVEPEARAEVPAAEPEAGAGLAEAVPEPPAGVPEPGMGLVGWLRWGWRQLTSMRTALILLFLLAVASIPGSLLPQRDLNPERVQEYVTRDPDLARWLDRLSLFDVYAAPWFVATYLLLFVSLTGCVVPRSWRHFQAIRSRPPAAPRHLSRLPWSARFETTATPRQVAEAARDLLRDRRFRVDVTAPDPGRDDASDTSDAAATSAASDPAGARPGPATVAAEKGHLGETGNLAFHLALLVLLIAVGSGAAYGYRGNVLVTEGDGFANTLTAYDAFQRGSVFSPDRLPPFSVTVEDFHADYVREPGTRRGQPTEFTARVSYRPDPGAPLRRHTLRVNHPLNVRGAQIYLLGHGYAPTFTVRDGKGDVAFEGAVPFLPTDEGTFASEGVVKVPDARPEQLGFVGLFWPTAAQDATGRPVSAFPAADKPAVALFPFKGDLGLDSGLPQSVYQLDTARMRQLRAKREPLRPGETMALPEGAGSVTFTGYREWVSLQVNHDPGRTPALLAGLVAIGAIVTTFSVRRRRMWVRARRGEAPDGGLTVVEVGGLTLGAATTEFDELAERLRSALPTESASSGTPGEE